MNPKYDNQPGRITAILMIFLGVVLCAVAWAKKPVIDPVTPIIESITGTTIGGSEIAPLYYHITENIDLGDVTFIGPTVIVADGDFKVSGNPTIHANAEVTIYFAGNFTVSGSASINNLGRPQNLKIYATQEFDADTMLDADRQRITLNGNVDFTGAIYAPEAIFTSNGGGAKGATYGAILAYNATYNGAPGPFHYDESLAAETIPNQPFSTSGYRPIRDPDQLVNNDPNMGTYAEFIDSFFGS
ncbi:DUF7305 domain-containing protein [Cerasicoccus arenae]|uniref:DUF7305 domain-containing protein n=1 Tax=Cerasicoccus arenae TaxID=424488 RepID=A0A8J3DJ07_9BACT|nr:hypothetical protein [Cerasicoccus arenae]MBK1858559.1 hypothetical protein [Cerasicoccus arenae]GHC06296.1 hypothetical protein GCM10007047_24250 [Cerasicoccus arenae]